MTVSPERALAQALRATIQANTDCAAYLGAPARVFDDQPAEPIYPFVTLGEVQSRAADGALVAGLDHAVTVHVWSRHGGKAEAMDVLAALRAALHDQPVAVAGRHLVLLLVSFVDVFRSGDGRSFHGVLRLRALTEPV